jgi:hypothetical protein
MSDSIIVSRNFVEFGPFKSEEIADFKKRGIIMDTDYLLVASTHSWLPAGEWTLDCAPDAATTEADAAPKKAKAPAKKKSSAKKAA